MGRHNDNIASAPAAWQQRQHVTFTVASNVSKSGIGQHAYERISTVALCKWWSGYLGQSDRVSHAALELLGDQAMKQLFMTSRAGCGTSSQA